MLTVKFVTPEKILFNDDASYVTVPTVMGGIGIYKDHQPLLALLKSGKVKIQNENIVKNFSIDSDDGFIEVDSNTVLIATQKATAV